MGFLYFVKPKIWEEVKLNLKSLCKYILYKYKRYKRQNIIVLFTLVFIFLILIVYANTQTMAQGSGNISEVQLLARAINGEARGEPYEGQVAVGAKTLIE